MHFQSFDGQEKSLNFSYLEMFILYTYQVQPLDYACDKLKITILTPQRFKYYSVCYYDPDPSVNPGGSWILPCAE